MTRKANILVNKFQGGNAGYGMVLQELVQGPQPVPGTGPVGTARASARSPNKKAPSKAV